MVGQLGSFTSKSLSWLTMFDPELIEMYILAAGITFLLLCSLVKIYIYSILTMSEKSQVNIHWALSCQLS